MTTVMNTYSQSASNYRRVENTSYSTGARSPTT